MVIATVTPTPQRMADMVDLDSVRRLALALPSVAEKKHFHLDGFAVDGKGFVTVEKGGAHVMLSLDSTTAQELALAHPNAISVLRRNGKPIGVRIGLDAVDETVLASAIESAWRYSAPKALRDGTAFKPSG